MLPRCFMIWNSPRPFKQIHVQERHANFYTSGHRHFVGIKEGCDLSKNL